jgi:hypothetical protein
MVDSLTAVVSSCNIPENEEHADTSVKLLKTSRDIVVSFNHGHRQYKSVTGAHHHRCPDPQPSVPLIFSPTPHPLIVHL